MKRHDPPRIMIVAAEASGDVLGEGLIRALKRKLPQVQLSGVGGPRMAAEGIISPFDISQLSVLGIVEGVAAYPRVVARVRDTLSLAQREEPDLAVLIDSWGFTLRVAQQLKRWKPDLPVVKFVGPQIWASRPGRAKTLAATIDHLLSILPFDAPFYEPLGLPVTFVGNPAMSRDFSRADGKRARKAMGAAPNQPVLLVLPGSRPGEIRRLMTPFGDAVRRLKATYPDLVVAVSAAESVAEAVKAGRREWGTEVHIVEGEAQRYDAMKAATVALACSGTVSTELAMAGVPMVIAYRMSPLTYAIGKRIVTTSWVTLVNIAAGEEIAPEFLQDKCTGANLAAAVAVRLESETLRRDQVARQNEALVRLGRGKGDPFETAADVVLELLAS